MESIIGINESLGFLQELRAKFGEATFDQETMLPDPWVVPQKDIEDAQLTNYAKLVLPYRFLHAKAYAFSRDYHYIDGYLDGAAKGNPYVLYMLTKAQIELASLVNSVLNAAVGDVEEPYSKQTILKADRLLYGFLYGDVSFRSQELKATIAGDEALDSKPETVLKSLDQLKDVPGLEDIELKYVLCSQFLDPSFKNISIFSNVLQIDRLRAIKDAQYIKHRALIHTAETMANCSLFIFTVFDETEWPFGLLDAVSQNS